MRTQAMHNEGCSGVPAAQRVNQALTARWRSARWYGWRSARRGGLRSDRLTLLGLGAQIGAGICYALARYDRRGLLAGDCAWC